MDTEKRREFTPDPARQAAALVALVHELENQGIPRSQALWDAENCMHAEDHDWTRHLRGETDGRRS